ncbi:head-tail connector protein [Caproicibacterium sp. BJN0003]|uniref:head-tail connector protein n=1 Tax=Caproicibacterium sp. BJN0003 TaxID=2994078 RepID=UPI0022532303|nr:head-tail connector protein [Caproicibacterium sp. BJN0003]UZT82142.1 head-tail connector protein [Caproicibacterium sp. BJN0003]
MMATSLLPSARNWLRITSNSLDDEILQTMSACIIDLQNSGVNRIDTEDFLIQQAIKLYCKSQFGYDKDAEKFSQAYEHLKASLSLSGDYNSTS